MTGYIRLHRKCLENRFFRNPSVWHYFQYCLLRANYDDVDIPLGGELIHLEKGQFLTSINKDSEKTGLTVSAIRHARSVLEKDAMISMENSTKYSIVEVCNYKALQADIEQDAARDTNLIPAYDIATDKKEKIKNKNKKEDKNKGRLSLESWLFMLRMKARDLGYKVKKEEFKEFYLDGLSPDEALEEWVKVCS
mgnify:CR=1 FL=1